MRHGVPAACGALLTFLVVLPAALAAAGQGGGAGDYTIPRTPWGDPDLEGIWNSKTTTPLERPDEYEGREFLTAEEVASLEGNARRASAEGSGATLLPERAERGTAIDVAGAYNSVFSSRGTTVVKTGRTSLVIDPPDGKIPYSAEGLDRVAAEMEYRKALFAADLQDHVTMAEGPEDRPNDRCLGFTLPCTSMYCAFSRIVQTPGTVTIYYEAGHTGGAYRTIPLDGRAHVPPHIRLWYGDSVGHWEGDTLVVESKNFTDKTRFQGSSENLHVVERFTRVAADRILYEFMVDDPTSWTRPWSAEIPMVKTEGPMFEYACHEGNYDVRHLLEIYRNLEIQAAADASEPGSK